VALLTLEELPGAFSMMLLLPAPGTDLDALITRLDDEEGTEAAAATSVGIGPTSMPPSFVVNRPFLVVTDTEATHRRIAALLGGG
jgi:hypothetical protein